MKTTLITSILLFFTATAFGANEQNCGQITMPVPYKYCITKTIGSTNENVVYYMHGAGGNENQWNDISSEIYQIWTTENAQPPIVINISLGPVWLLVEKNASPKSGLLEAFGAAIMPTMETLALGKPAASRQVLGLSMGGFNTTQMIFKLPAGTFKRANLICPGIVDLSPWATEAQIQDFVAANQAEEGYLKSIAQIGKVFVADEATWNSSIAPLTLIRNADGKTLPEIFVATNEEDFNFKPGGNLFAEEAVKAGAQVTKESWAGGHCELQNETLSQILLQ